MLLPLQSANPNIHRPRALPWAGCLLAFQAVTSQKLYRTPIYIFAKILFRGREKGGRMIDWYGLSAEEYQGMEDARAVRPYRLGGNTLLRMQKRAPWFGTRFCLFIYVLRLCAVITKILLQCSSLKNSKSLLRVRAC